MNYSLLYKSHFVNHKFQRDGVKLVQNPDQSHSLVAMMKSNDGIYLCKFEVDPEFSNALGLEPFCTD
jgi:hypothetical protein